MTPHLPLIPAMAVVQWGVNPFRTNKDFKFAGRTAILLVVYRRPHGDAPSPAKSRARAIGRGVPPSPPGITTRLPAAGMNPLEVHRGIQAAVSSAVDALEEISRPIT